MGTRSLPHVLPFAMGLALGASDAFLSPAPGTSRLFPRLLNDHRGRTPFLPSLARTRPPPWRTRTSSFPTRPRHPRPRVGAIVSPSAPPEDTKNAADRVKQDANRATQGNERRKKEKRLTLAGRVGRAVSRAQSFLTIMITWHLFRFLLVGLNKVECYNREVLMRALFHRGDRGLLTVSNHMCVYDDPGLWSAIVPFWRTGAKKMRWAMCTDDIYNANHYLRNILTAGKTLPIRRTRGMEQPLFKVFFEKLEHGEWGHIFAEGGIRQPWRFGGGEPILADFKAGIGRLLLRSKDPPLVLPMYHIGMHQVAPETPVKRRGRGKLSKTLPNIGRTVRVYVGEPIDVRPIVNKCREIAAFVREHVLKLEAVARRDYYGDDPETSPYSVAQ